MIVAAWSDSERALSQCYERCVSFSGAQPASRAVLSKGFVAAWGFHTAGWLDIERGLACVGRVESLPRGVLDVHDLACLSGDFALFGILTEGLLVARGLAGRPVYHARTADGVVVAGSQLAAVAHAVGELHLNNRRLHAMLEARPWPAASTLYQAVERLPCGGRAAVLGPYRVLASGSRRLRARAVPSVPRELAEECRDVLRAAVHRAMQGARRSAVMVSGGLDSSAVLAHAVTGNGSVERDVLPVNLAFGAEGDDRPHLRGLCSFLNVSPLSFSPADCGPTLLEAFVCGGSPVTWPTAGWELFLMRAARKQGCDIVLTGVGGDDLLAAGPGDVSRHLAGHGVVAAVWGAATYRTHWRSHVWTRAYDFVLRPLLASRLPPRLRSLARSLRGQRRRAWLRRQDAPEVDEARSSVKDNLQHNSLAAVQQWLQGRLADMLDYRACLELASGCERRDPFLDDRVIEFAASVPQLAFLQGNDTRGLFRASLAGVVPESVRQRRDKSQFTTALVQMIQMSDMTGLRALATMKCLSHLCLVDAYGYRRDLERQLGLGAGGDWLAVWPALAVEAFLRSRAGEPGTAA